MGGRLKPCLGDSRTYTAVLHCQKECAPGREGGRQVTPPRVFVSHSQHDVEFARELVGALRAGGADVWCDEDTMQSGYLGPVIERELQTRPQFIVILSPAALRSQWVEEECRWAYIRLLRHPTYMIVP